MLRFLIIFKSIWFNNISIHQSTCIHCWVSWRLSLNNASRSVLRFSHQLNDDRRLCYPSIGRLPFDLCTSLGYNSVFDIVNLSFSFCHHLLLLRNPHTNTHYVYDFRQHLVYYLLLHCFCLSFIVCFFLSKCVSMLILNTPWEFEALWDFRHETSSLFYQY